MKKKIFLMAFVFLVGVAKDFILRKRKSKKALK